MPEAVAQEARKQPAVPELIRNPKAALQEAKGRLGSLIESSNAGLTELDHLLERVSKEDWTFSGMRKRFGALRSRAESARASALRAVDELPGNAMTALASVGRARIQDLSKGLKRVATRLEGPAPAASARNGSAASE